MDDRELEALLGETLSQAAPGDDLITQVSPWRTAMNRILWGIGLCSITLNFWALDVILPAIGTVLVFLGSRMLRRENGGFRLFFFAATVKLLYSSVWLVLNGSVLGGILAQTEPMTALHIGILVLDLAQALFLWAGLRCVQKKAGMSPGAGSAFSLFLWKAIILYLGLTGAGGLVVFVLLVLYILTFRSLHKLSGALDSAGYVISPAPVKLPDRAFILGYTALMLAGILTGSLWFQRYPMDWQPAQTAISGEAQAVRQKLLDLGFPETVLNDLTEDEILSMSEAEAVLWESREHPMNNGRRVTAKTGPNSYHTETVSDVKELTTTGIAVKLPAARETWRMILHFHWTQPPALCATEAIRLYNNPYSGWQQSMDATGRVLCDVNGVTCAAPYWSLGWQHYTSTGLFAGGVENDLLATFSLNPEADNNRGYLIFDILETDSGWIIDQWFWYYHTEAVVYPTQTALDGFLYGTNPFFSTIRSTWDTIQFRGSEMEDALNKG